MTFTIRRPAPAAIALLAALAVSACASRPKPMGPVATGGPPPPPSSQGPGYAPEPGAVSEGPAGALPGSSQDFVIHAGDLVYFAFNSFDISPEARAILDAQAAWLQRYPDVRVRIEGNTDERGTREYNFALGARRASAVRDYLIGRGVSGARIETISYGKERPVDTGSGDEADYHNRNAHTVITQGAR